MTPSKPSSVLQAANQRQLRREREEALLRLPAPSPETLAILTAIYESSGGKKPGEALRSAVETANNAALESAKIQAQREHDRIQKDADSFTTGPNGLWPRPRSASELATECVIPSTRRDSPITTREGVLTALKKYISALKGSDEPSEWHDGIYERASKGEGIPQDVIERLVKFQKGQRTQRGKTTQQTGERPPGEPRLHPPRKK